MCLRGALATLGAVMQLLATQTALGAGADEAASAKAGSGLEEIVVTARKRAEELGDTPVSISAFTAKSLQERQVERLDDVARFVPNLVFDSGTGGTGGSANAQVFIRGIGQSDFLFTTDPGVGIYIDGVFFPRSLGAILDVVDLERIEVVRGPQGTLFGKNTIGGAISLTSARPTDTFGGHGELAVGNYNRLDFKGSVNIPLIEDRLASSIAFSRQRRDGYVRRLSDGNSLGDVDSTAARGRLLLKAADNVNVLLAADVTRRREQTIATSGRAFSNSGLILNLWNAYAGRGTFGTQYDTGDPFTTNASGPSYSDLDLWGVSGTVDWTFESAALKSISAYRSQKARFAGDDDASPLQYLETNNNDHEHMFSQELQLTGQALQDRLTWLVGAFYLRESANNHNHNWLYPGLYAGLERLAGPINGSALSAPTAPGGPGNPLNIGYDGNQMRYIAQDTESAALYTHAIFKLTPKLNASAGVRYSHDKKEFDTSVLRIDANVYVLPPGTHASNSWNSVSPKLGLDYHWTSDVMSYVSVSRGFKSGGFNGRPRQANAALQTFDPETAWAYETGLKSSWLERRLVANAAVFYTKYQDIQFTATQTVNNDIAAVVANAGEATIKGVELELAARPVSGFDLTLAVGYTDASYDRIAPGVSGITTASKLPKTPEWTGSVGAQYAFALPRGMLTLRSDYSYRSYTETTPTNTAMLAQPAFGLLSARIALASNDGTREVALFGTNLTDKLYVTNGLEAVALFGQAEVNYGRPREWGLSASVRF
jgi:iron complex outermembrane receptor protein